MNGIIYGIFSFFIPGFGQVVEGYTLRGFILLIISILISTVLVYLKVDNNIHHIISAVYGLIAGYDAYRLY